MAASSTEDRARGTGRSTRQLRAAPKNAVYIIPAGTERYFKKLAEWQHRRDITFLAAGGNAEELVAQLKGLSRPIAVDHAALALPMRVWEEIGLINQVAMRGISER